MTELVTVSGHVDLSSDVWRTRLYEDLKRDAENRKYHQNIGVYIFNSKLGTFVIRFKASQIIDLWCDRL